MSSVDNVRKAFHVVYHTYENIHKLMDYCKTVAGEQSGYVSVVDKFLRYKSDNDFSGWFIQNFIILFQNKNDIVLENEWRDGPLYVMELELYDAELESEERKELPRIRLSKFEYENMQNWASGCSPANHWRFYYPLRNRDIMDIKKDGDTLSITPIDQEASNRYYWGVKKITSKSIPLIGLNADNVVEKVFKTFDSL
ncbi:hypothetical protein J2Y03_004609 [Neobacillus niacini]|uniref:hypothetical protein n=1 Tax=Neobacillus niacini TaxID=86668 RepID=UPI00286677E0|nr:hypothetical protein [Neobacillus niacini]MDR7079551.1 hypothetical protein [Neobacillus niacini]